VFAGDAVTIVALATGFGDEPLLESHFHIRVTGRGNGVRPAVVDAAPAGRPNEYTATHVFPEAGRYEVGFASHSGRHHIEGATIVLVAAREPTPEPPPATAAPPETSAPPPETAAPPPETASPPPETAAPAPETAAPSPAEG
jgi:hypothetical protein